MALITVAAGEKLTAAKLNSAFDLSRIAYQTADQTNSTTTFVSSNSLTLTVAANSGYTFDTFICYDTNSTADMQWRWSLPSGAAVRQGVWMMNTTNTSSPTTVSIDVIDTTGTNAGGQAAGVKLSLQPSGLIATGATAGSVTFQFAQVTASGSTILGVNSWIRLTKVL